MISYICTKPAGWIFTYAEFITDRHSVDMMMIDAWDDSLLNSIHPHVLYCSCSWFCTLFSALFF